MAKYTINYACGHGSTVKNLVGKTSERERKIAWFEQNLVCPECYKAQQQAKDDNSPKTASVHTLVAQGVYLYVQINGQINKHQDQLKSLGFGWTKDIASGLVGFLSMKEPDWKFVKVSDVLANKQALLDWIKACEAELAELGYKLDIAINDLDFGMLMHQLDQQTKEQAKKDDWLTNNPKPSNKEALGFMFDKHGSPLSGWNGKIYGRKGGYHYYYDGEKHPISNDAQLAITAYQKALADWEQKRKDAGV